MENFQSVDFGITRNEVLLEDVLFYPIKNKTEDNSHRLRAGTAVDAIYDVCTVIYVKKNLSGQQRDNITNAIIAYFILKGEKAVDEKKLARFIHKETGVAVKVEFTTVNKRYKTGFRPCIKLESETIDLLHLENNITCN